MTLSAPTACAAGVPHRAGCLSRARHRGCCGQAAPSACHTRGSRAVLGRPAHRHDQPRPGRPAPRSPGPQRAARVQRIDARATRHDAIARSSSIDAGYANRPGVAASARHPTMATRCDCSGRRAHRRATRNPAVDITPSRRRTDCPCVEELQQQSRNPPRFDEPHHEPAGHHPSASHRRPAVRDQRRRQRRQPRSAGRRRPQQPPGRHDPISHTNHQTGQGQQGTAQRRRTPGRRPHHPPRRPRPERPTHPRRTATTGSAPRRTRTPRATTAVSPFFHAEPRASAGRDVLARHRQINHDDDTAAGRRCRSP